MAARLNTELIFFNPTKLNSIASSHFIVKLRGQYTTRRTGQDDGKYQGRNDRLQRVDRDSWFALPFLQTVAVAILLQFGEDSEKHPKFTVT